MILLKRFGLTDEEQQLFDGLDDEDHDGAAYGSSVLGVVAPRLISKR